LIFQKDDLKKNHRLIILFIFIFVPLKYPMNKTTLLSSSQILDIFSASHIATAIYTGSNLNIEAITDAMLAFWGKDRSITGIPLEQALPELAGQRFITELQSVLTTGKTITGIGVPAELLIDSELQTRYFDYEYRAIRNTDGEIYCVLHTSGDATERVIGLEAVERSHQQQDMLDKEKSLNEELASANEELSAINEELAQTQQNLHHLTGQLEERVLKRTQALAESEAGLRYVIDDAPVAIAVLKGEQLIVEHANQYILNAWGKTAELIGKPVSEAMPEQEAKKIVPILLQVLKTGTQYVGVEAPGLTTENGKLKEVYSNFIFKPLKNKKGVTHSVIIVATDVTEQVRNRLANEAAKHRLEAMVHNTPVAMSILKGQDLIVEAVNQPMLAVWRRSRDEVIGRSLVAIFPELESQANPGRMRGVMKSGKRFALPETEVILADVDGTLKKHYANFSYDPITNQDGAINSILVTVVDITEAVTTRKRLEESKARLQEATNELAAANEELISVNEEMASINEELTALNEELAGVNEEQASTNEELQQSQGSLHQAIETLEMSEARLDQIIEQLPASISLITGHDLVVESTNASNLSYWQKQRVEVIGKPLLEILPELQEQAFPGQLRGVLETGEMIVQHEWPVNLVDKEGKVQTTFVDYSYQAITDKQGRRIGVLVMSNDVTTQVEARRRLEQSEKNLKLANEELAQSTGDLLFTIDAAGLATFDLNPVTGNFKGNDLLKSWFGLVPGDEIPLQAATDVIVEADRGRVIKAIQHSLDYRYGGKYDVEYAITSPIGSGPRFVKAKGKAIFDEHRQAIRMSGTLQDITEQKQDDQRKNDFIGMVSHELKTPLTSLSAIVQLAGSRLKEGPDPFLAGAMEKANLQVGKMTKMINGFLNISRLESGKIAIIKQEFSLNELLAEAIDEYKLISPGSPIEMEACPLVTVSADREKIGSVVANIIGNAIKYSAKATPVLVKCELKDGSAIVSVKDKGIGINDTDAKKLFDRYYRVDNPNTKHISGFGIGLYLSSEIIERHGGRIWVESELGVGSTFYFSLPLG
jgi:two-component system sensor histidine kinase VicK